MRDALTRRGLLGLTTAATVTLLAGCASGDDGPADARTSDTVPADADGARSVTVFKDPSCGCCGGWVSHAEAHGFTVAIEHPDNLGDVFEQHRIAPELRSCHLTLDATGTLFVGHVPVKFVLQYLAEPPTGARGLTVPAMPIGTPGMEMGDAFDPYEVLTLLDDGSTTTYAEVRSAADQEV